MEKDFYTFHISSFLEKLKAEDGLALNTTLSYGKDLELFSKFLCEKKIGFLEVTEENFRDYLYELHKENLKSSSISRKLSCLKNFYKFLVNENLIKDNPTEHLQSPKRDAKLPKFL